jgi:hypothetical protein
MKEKGIIRAVIPFLRLVAMAREGAWCPALVSDIFYLETDGTCA